MGKGGRHGDLSNYVFFKTVQGLLRRRRSPDTSTLERMYCMQFLGYNISRSMLFLTVLLIL